MSWFAFAAIAITLLVLWVVIKFGYGLIDLVIQTATAIFPPFPYFALGAIAGLVWHMFF